MPTIKICSVCGKDVVFSLTTMDDFGKIIVQGTEGELDDIHPECLEKLQKELEEKVCVFVCQNCGGIVNIRKTKAFEQDGTYYSSAPCNQCGLCHSISSDPFPIKEGDKCGLFFVDGIFEVRDENNNVVYAMMDAFG